MEYTPTGLVQVEALASVLREYYIHWSVLGGELIYNEDDVGEYGTTDNESVTGLGEYGTIDNVSYFVVGEYGMVGSNLLSGVGE